MVDWAPNEIFTDHDVFSLPVVYLMPTKDIYVVKENQNQAAVCFVATPAAAVPVDVTVVATEDDVPSARCMTYTHAHTHTDVHFSGCLLTIIRGQHSRGNVTTYKLVVVLHTLAHTCRTLYWLFTLCPSAPQNFIANSLRLTIPPNTPPLSEQCVAFSIVDNKVALEPYKTFSIKVLTPPKVILVRPPGHVLIVDDDGKASYSDWCDQEVMSL